VVGRDWGAFEFEEELVRVTPVPFFAGFEGADDGMLGFLLMLGGVAVLGVVATAYMAA
jgi:hypothetical protein